MLAEIVTWLYGASGAVTVAMYVPQIVAVWRDREGAKSTSLVMWGFWTVCSVISVCYAVFVTTDPVYGAISTGNLLGCGSIWSIASRRRVQAQRTLAVTPEGQGVKKDRTHKVRSFRIFPPQAVRTARRLRRSLRREGAPFAGSAV